ncbi:MAG: tetratricopeptide repeat protein [Proteobacteria bacterium]|nr:tetratricopeptide repeat protein [Pseudomonadota bacterium]
MGEADARLGKFAEAEETLKRALRQKPDYARAQFSLRCTFADCANRGRHGRNTRVSKA